MNEVAALSAGAPESLAAWVRDGELSEGVQCSIGRKGSTGVSSGYVTNNTHTTHTTPTSSGPGAQVPGTRASLRALEGPACRRRSFLES